MNKKNYRLLSFIVFLSLITITGASTTLIIEIIKVFKTENVTNLFSFVFVLVFFFIHATRNLPMQKPEHIDLPKFRKFINSILASIGIFFCLLTILQIGYLFGFYQKPVNSGIYVGSILFILLYIWINRTLSKFIRKSKIANK